MGTDPDFRRRFFDRLGWAPDRMALDGIVYRLEHSATDRWELGEHCFRFYKTRALLAQYAEFWGRRLDFVADRVVEIGLWDGGSLALWFEYFHPERLVGLDVGTKGDSEYFRAWAVSRGADDRVATHWGVDQADRARVLEIVGAECPAGLDLVIDDASHCYHPTRAGFETLFPFLRPGGLYVIEDWAWNHWSWFEPPPSWTDPLSDLVLELAELVGSHDIESGAPAMVACLEVLPGFVAVERGAQPWPTATPWDLGETIFRGFDRAPGPGRRRPGLQSVDLQPPGPWPRGPRPWRRLFSRRPG